MEVEAPGSVLVPSHLRLRLRADAEAAGTGAPMPNNPAWRYTDWDVVTRSRDPVAWPVWEASSTVSDPSVAEATEEFVATIAVVVTDLTTAQWGNYTDPTDVSPRVDTRTQVSDEIYYYQPGHDAQVLSLGRDADLPAGTQVAHVADGHMTWVTEEYSSPDDIPYVLFGRLSGLSLSAVTGPLDALSITPVFEPDLSGAPYRLLTAYHFDPGTGKAIYAVLVGSESAYESRSWEATEVYEWSNGASRLLARVDGFEHEDWAWSPVFKRDAHLRHLPQMAIVWLERVTPNEAWALTSGGEVLQIVWP
jgi:hypothetical protein